MSCEQRLSKKKCLEIMGRSTLIFLVCHIADLNYLNLPDKGLLQQPVSSTVTSVSVLELADTCTVAGGGGGERQHGKLRYLIYPVD
jgi:hypothetical protein